jgi:hypothetical protein
MDDQSASGRPTDERNVNDVADDVAKSVSETVGAILGVGVSVARLFARATAQPGHEVTVTPGQGPLSEMIQYGVATVANVIRVIPATLNDASRVARGTAQTVSRSTAAQGAGTGVPTVRVGSTLRVPMSIENPTDQPMNEMQFKILRVASEPSGNGASLPASAIRFDPPVLTVAARDFEKLTVLIDVPSGTAPGRYDASIGLMEGSFELSLVFDVVPATASTTAAGP